MSSTISGLVVPADEAAAITFESGIGTTGLLDTRNYWNWNGGTPAGYGFHGYAIGSVYKAGPATVGTGGTITYSFDPGSGWTAAEQAAIRAAMQLWSDESGVSFMPAGSAGSALETFYRAGSTTAGNPGVAGEALTEMNSTVGITGTTTAGTVSAGGYTAIDTTAFGDVNSFNQFGGYGVTTILHELGHVLGLGHAGPYNDTVDQTQQQNGPYDSQAYSLMSYISPDDTGAAYYGEYAARTGWGVADGVTRTPLTPMMDDVIAAQQIYGLPVGGGLQGGQVFGFNCNITDGTQAFFNFAIDTTPIVNLYDAGTGNTLDLSGFSSGSAVNLNGGSFSSCDGLTDNLSISIGTQIDTFVGGAGDDVVTLNGDPDTVNGGGGLNTVVLAGDEGQYTFSQLGNDQVSLSGDGQSAMLTDVQIARFADGQTQALLGAAPPASTAGAVSVSVASPSTVPAITRGADSAMGGVTTLSVAGAASGLQVAVPNGTALVLSSAGQASSVAVSGITQVQFTDGTAVIDGSGDASDVARLYLAAFGRQADAAGLEYFAGLLAQPGVGLSQIAGGFLASGEGQVLASETVPAFIAQLYGNTFGTSPDAAGLAYWSGMVDAGATSRADAMVGIAESGQAQTATEQSDGSNDAAEIDRLYQAVIGRAPDMAGSAYWTQLLQNGASAEQIASGMLQSSEFANDALTTTGFVTQLYQNALGRAPDASGLAWFTAQVNSGVLSEAGAAATFAQSPEAVAHAAGATHQNWVWLPSTAT